MCVQRTLDDICAPSVVARHEPVQHARAQLLVSGSAAVFAPEAQEAVDHDGGAHLRVREGAKLDHRPSNLGEIGRASCRERVCQYVSISVVAVSLKNKTTTHTT